MRAAHVVPALPETEGPPLVSRRRPADLPGVLRHQAADRDPVSRRLCVPRIGARAPGGRGGAPTAARSRVAGRAYARSRRAAVAALLPRLLVPGALHAGRGPAQGR